MPHILVIEHSPTLRRAVCKHLLATGYQVEELTEFSTAADRLAASTPFDAAVVGWPAHTDPATDEFLVQLTEPPFDRLPIMVLAPEADAVKLNWVSTRGRTAFVLWDDYKSSDRPLSKLLAAQNQAPHDFLSAPQDDSIRILFVDDSPTVRAKIRRLLTKHGYEVGSAGSVPEAMDLARKQPFDLAIIDYFMPGATGDVLCHQLRADPRTTQISTAILTSSYSDQVIKDCLAAGAVECMFKNEADELFLARVAAMSRSVQITRKIEQERKRLSSILSSVGDGVYGVDNNGLITFANKAAKSILGYDDDGTLIGKSPEEIFHPLEDSSHDRGETTLLHKAYCSGEELHGYETEFRHRDGMSILAECTITPLHIQNRRAGAVVAFRDVTTRKLLEEELKWQANHDPLTELHNRKYLEDTLEQEVRRLKRSAESSALLYIDLDRFKYINDTTNHATGDRLLIQVSRQLQARLRETDVLARIGGDEFALILRSVEKSQLETIADQYRQAISDFPFVAEQRSYTVNCSVGVAPIDRNTLSANDVLANADIACHIAKGRGRSQTHVFEANNDERVAMDLELGWSNRLRVALEKDEFQLFYQPIVALSDIDLTTLPEEAGELWRHVCNTTPDTEAIMEVLVRLDNKRGERILPGAFLPTAERFNLMRQIDQWVIDNALEQLARLRHDGYEVSYTINLSGQSVDHIHLINHVAAAMERLAIDPYSLIFEITETCAISNVEAAQSLIRELRDLGCRFALDDFGSGYCSFSRLKHLPVDFIKIDGSFVQGVVQHPTDRAIITSINNIAHSLGKQTVAEWVDSPTALRILKECGVDLVQGHYVGRPSREFDLPPPRLDSGQHHKGEPA